jgi:DNA-binding transcriptional LysR family regulator
VGQLENMKIFIRVVEAGGIGIAAEQLCIAKSAVSRRLADLESDLGVTLINRTTRTSNITEIGKMYYSRALNILDDVTELNNTTSNQKRSLQGTLRLAAPSSFGVEHLSPILSEYIKQHPDLSLSINFADNYIDLIEGGYDLAFRIGTLQDSTLIAKPIAPIKLVMCASPDYLKAHGTPTSPDDLKHHQLLYYSFSNVLTWRLTDKQGGKINIPITEKIISNNGEFLNHMGIAGHGIILSPTFISWKALNKGTLVPLLTDYLMPSTHAYAIYPKARYLPQKTRLLINYLKEKFNDNPYWDQ